MNSLVLTSRAPWYEIWRLWTAHFVHSSPEHLLMNVAAAVPPLLLSGWRFPLRAFAWILAAAPIISIALLALVRPERFYGAGALVIGLWIMAAIAAVREHRNTFIGWALLLVLFGKLIYESAHRLPAIDPLPLAHWLGALAGLAGAALTRSGGRDAARLGHPVG